MSQSITLWGASYTQVPGVSLPKTGGGTALFSDASVTTAVESDVASGKTFLKADGSIGTGSNSGGGGSSMQIGVANATMFASNAIAFSGLNGEPTSFYIISTSDVSGSADGNLAALVYDGSGYHGQKITTTSNAQVSAETSGFSHTYNSGTLSVTSSNAHIGAMTYTVIYTYGGDSSNIGTADVQVGSGATSITFTGLPEEPSCWSCIFKSDFSTSSGYQRVITVMNDGADIIGLEMDSAAKVSSSHWTANYSSGSLTITSQGTNAGGYFHQPGYYQLTYGIGEIEPPTIEPLTVTQNGTYQESGKAYSPVTVNVSGGGSWTVKQTTWSNNSTSTVSHTFSNLSGTPKAAILRCTSQLTRSSSNTYYYIADIIWDGTNAWGNYHLRSNGTFNNVAKDAASGFNVSTGSNSITFSSDASSRSSAPGSFYNGTYELTYWY